MGWKDAIYLLFFRQNNDGAFCGLQYLPFSWMCAYLPCLQTQRTAETIIKKQDFFLQEIFLNLGAEESNGGLEKKKEVT